MSYGGKGQGGHGYGGSHRGSKRSRKKAMSGKLFNKLWKTSRTLWTAKKDAEKEGFPKVAKDIEKARVSTINAAAEGLDESK